MGLFIGEMWDFEELAADCADDGCYEFFLAAAPIHSPAPSAPRSTRSP